MAKVISAAIFAPLRLAQIAMIAILANLGADRAHAASLRVSPTGAELHAPASTTTFSLRNDEDRILHSQIRVYRWQQKNGGDELLPTSDVVASPPMARMQPGTDYTIRVVRVSKQALIGEESYRIVIDELPDPARKRSGTVELVVRHVLPVFFRSQDAAPASVSWTLTATDKGSRLSATNHGASHLRLANLSLAVNGKVWLQRDGLIGYVLAGATMQWNFPTRPPGNGAIRLSATGKNGPYRADVSTAR